MIQNDMPLSVDSGKAVALTLLYPCVAFGTIAHSLLYDCLHEWFGLDEFSNSLVLTLQ